MAKKDDDQSVTTPTAEDIEQSQETSGAATEQVDQIPDYADMVKRVHREAEGNRAASPSHGR